MTSLDIAPDMLKQSSYTATEGLTAVSGGEPPGGLVARWLPSETGAAWLTRMNLDRKARPILTIVLAQENTKVLAVPALKSFLGNPVRGVPHTRRTRSKVRDETRVGGVSAPRRCRLTMKARPTVSG